MRGGSLTRFRTDEWYDQEGNGLLVDVVRGGLQGLKRTRNPLKLPSNILSGFETGLTRGVKRKAEDVIKREITKRAKKALGNKDVQTPCVWPVRCFPSKSKELGIFLVSKKWIQCIRVLDVFAEIEVYLNVEACFLFGNS